jgi:hypothetical protein
MMNVKRVLDIIDNRIKELWKLQNNAMRRKNLKVKQRLIDTYAIKRLELQRLKEDISENNNENEGGK